MYQYFFDVSKSNTSNVYNLKNAIFIGSIMLTAYKLKTMFHCQKCLQRQADDYDEIQNSYQVSHQLQVTEEKLIKCMQWLDENVDQEQLQTEGNTFILNTLKLMGNEENRLKEQNEKEEQQEEQQQHLSQHQSQHQSQQQSQQQQNNLSEQINSDFDQSNDNNIISNNHKINSISRMETNYVNNIQSSITRHN